LHHFPTSEELFAAAVRRLVEMNVEAIHDELAMADKGLDPVTRGVRVLYRASRRRSFAMELELWAAARADVWLRQALLSHERAAAQTLERAVDQLFGPSVTDESGYRELMEITIHFLRGLTVSASLSNRGHDVIVDSWITAMKLALDRSAAKQIRPSKNPKTPIQQKD
jgi:AcrR family transcriptional regulator